MSRNSTHAHSDEKDRTGGPGVDFGSVASGGWGDGHVPDGGGPRARIRRLLATQEEDDIVRPAPPVPVREIFRVFWPYARPYRRWIAVSVLLIVAAPAIRAAKLYMIKVIVDEMLVPREVGPLVWIAPTLVGLTAVGGVVSFLNGYLSTWVGQRFLLSLRTSFFRHLQSLSLDFFERRRLGDLVSRLTGNVNAIESFVLSGVAQALSALFTLVFFVGALFYLEWRLALVTLLVVPLFALVIRTFSRLIKQASREKQRRSGSLTAIAEESLSNVALVQSYNRQESEVERLHRQNRGVFEAQMAATRVKSLFSPLIDTLQLFSALLVLGLGTWALANDQLTLGGLLLFVAYLNQLYGPLRGLGQLANTVYAASASAERIIEFMALEPTVKDREGALALAGARGAVSFDAVSFCYPERERDAVAEVSFDVAPGETVALVGHSGAGKSTLAKLMLRFYDPRSGSVRLDGHDLRDLQLRSLRENVAVLMQEALIFEGTIRDNIAYGRPDASTEEILAAAESADAHGFIAELPEGYATMVGQKGRRLSGGQRQRIAIARALLRDGSVLILDEPTTGVDVASGARILEPLRRLMSGRTTIVISHNLLTVREADAIVVLSEGRVVERGTHEELLAAGGPYARLAEAHAAVDPHGVSGAGEPRLVP